MIIHSAAHNDLDSVSLRERLYAARAEADHLRFSLHETEALLDAVESELRFATMRPLSRGEWHVASSQVIPAVVLARTVTRRMLSPRVEPGQRQEAVHRDLRIAEAAFGFLLGLRALRGGKER